MPPFRPLFLTLTLSATAFPITIVTPVDDAKIYASWAAKLSRAFGAFQNAVNIGDANSAWLSVFASGLVQSPEGKIQFHWIEKIKDSPSFKTQVDSIFSKAKIDSISAYKEFQSFDNSSIHPALEIAKKLNEFDSLWRPIDTLAQNSHEIYTWVAWMAWHTICLSNQAQDIWHIRTVAYANNAKGKNRANWEPAFAATIASDAWRIRSRLDSIELIQIIQDAKKIGARSPLPQWPPRNTYSR